MPATRLAARGITSDPYAFPQRSSGLVTPRGPDLWRSIAQMKKPADARASAGFRFANPDCLCRTAAANEMHDDHNDSDHQKYVDEPHRHVKCQKSQQPENEKYCADCGQHRSSWLLNAPPAYSQGIP